MHSVPAITQAEWNIMKALWDAGDWVTAGEIIERVSAGKPAHHRTVRTLLGRLVKKGAVEAQSEGSAGGHGGGIGYRYRARVSRDEATRAESRSFLKRLFDGSATPAIAYLLQDSANKLSPEDLRKLRGLLRKKEES